MASKTDIANLALVKLGESRIISIDDDNKKAGTIKAIFDLQRDSEMRKKRWSFTLKRALLAADVATPVYGYNVQFQLPTDCLRILSLGDFDLSADLSDYTGSNVAPYSIEGRKLMIDIPALDANGALPLRYIARVEDTQQWDACFVEAFACRLAMEACETLTQSTDRFNKAERQYRMALQEAARANAIELPSQRIADDTWMLSRIRG